MRDAHEIFYRNPSKSAFSAYTHFIYFSFTFFSRTFFFLHTIFFSPFFRILFFFTFFLHTTMISPSDSKLNPFQAEPPHPLQVQHPLRLPSLPFPRQVCPSPSSINLPAPKFNPKSDMHDAPPSPSCQFHPLQIHFLQVHHIPFARSRFTPSPPKFNSLPCAKFTPPSVAPCLLSSPPPALTHPKPDRSPPRRTAFSCPPHAGPPLPPHSKLNAPPS